VSLAAASPTRAGWRVRLTDPMVSAVLALGITQITAWGTSYYCLGVLAGPISQDTGWSRGFVFLGFNIRQYPQERTKAGKDSQRQSLGFKLLIKPSKHAVKRHVHRLGEHEWLPQYAP